MKYVLDTFAWIEYLKGSKKGTLVHEIMKTPEQEFLTVECTLGEITGFLLKEKTEIIPSIQLVKNNSEILRLYEHDWISGARERHEQRKDQKDFGLIDSLILVKAKEHNAKIVTGDEHFKKLKNVIFLS